MPQVKLVRRFLICVIFFAGAIVWSRAVAQQPTKPASTQAGEGDTRDQFKFMGGEKPLGDTTPAQGLEAGLGR